jgi:hypothetical protein
MKNVMTNIALPHEIAIINAQPTAGVCIMKSTFANVNEQAVRMQSEMNTVTNVFMLP